MLGWSGCNKSLLINASSRLLHPKYGLLTILPDQYGDTELRKYSIFPSFSIKRWYLANTFINCISPHFNGISHVMVALLMKSACLHDSRKEMSCIINGPVKQPVVKWILYPSVDNRSFNTLMHFFATTSSFDKFCAIVSIKKFRLLRSKSLGC